MSIAIGDQLDSKYRVLRRISGGGFGDVYLAEEELLGRQVAIKLLKVENPDDQNDLIHEMQSLYPLQHPNIVGFYHHFVQDRLLFLVMEYCGGGSLRGKMSKHPLTQNTVFELGMALTETLHFVHGKEIVHHDIKPDNILFTASGTLKIGDFGIANRNGGTWPYLTPEMHLGAVDTRDVRLDVYALGVTILEMLRNANPFHGMSREDMLRAKIRHDFIPTGMDRWVQDVIAKATHPAPELRFQTMQEFREAIESKHVTYIFDRRRIQAHALAAKAEKLLARKQATAASKCILQALYACPDCVAALIAAGRYNLFINRIDEAKSYLDRALSLNPRIHIQKELGWICLEAGNYSQAISLLTDHLQRNTADYEAFNLLLECFYRTERYDAAMQLARMMIEEDAPSGCFRNNGLLCGILSGADYQDLLTPPKLPNPIFDYNIGVLMQPPEVLKPLLLFQAYRFGLSTRKANTLTIAQDGIVREYTQPVITIGRMDGNHLFLADTNASRRHCVIVNHLDDVWIYDLGSRQGVFMDRKRIAGKAYLEGVHALTVGETELIVCSKLGLLV